MSRRSHEASRDPVDDRPHAQGEAPAPEDAARPLGTCVCV